MTKATGLTTFGVSKLKRRLHRFVGVHTKSCQNATLLEITCHGSNIHESLVHIAYASSTGTNAVSPKPLLLPCADPEGGDRGSPEKSQKYRVS